MFENILGNNKIKQELEQAVKLNKLSHSYMFIGTSGIGKKLIAKEFSKMLLCLGEQKYCNNCKSCIEFDSSNNPDFQIIQPDGSSIKIDQIREMQNKIIEAPIVSKRKIYLIDDAHLMTKEAQNCLLKTLEEPPEFVVIILIGSNENSFLSTIKSRCTIIKFQEIENSEIVKYMEQNYQMTNISENMLQIFSGSIGNAERLKDKQEDYSKVEEIINNLDKKDLIDIVQASEILYKSKENINDILDYINIILLKMAKENYLYTNCIKIVENTKKGLAQNANYDMCIDDLLFKMWEEVN